MRRLASLYSVGLSQTLRPTSSNVASLCLVLNLPAQTLHMVCVSMVNVVELAMWAKWRQRRRWWGLGLRKAHRYKKESLLISSLEFMHIELVSST